MPAVKLVVVVVPVETIVPASKFCVTVRSASTSTTSPVVTLPVPAALNSKSVLDVVVVIKLSFINISSNCTSPLTVKLFKLVCPVTVKFSVVVRFDTLTLSAFISCKVPLPVTLRSCVTTKSLLGITTSPVPAARNSKSAFDVVVEM